MTQVKPLGGGACLVVMGRGFCLARNQCRSEAKRRSKGSRPSPAGSGGRSGCKQAGRRIRQHAGDTVSVQSIAQHSQRQRFQPRQIENLHVALLDVQQAILLEAAQHPAHRFRRLPQIVGDIGARHRQLETTR